MSNRIIKRLLALPERSFFLFGPRGVGKSTWLKQVLPEACFFDLLDASLYLELSQDPHKLEAMTGNIPAASWVVIDEIQKIPSLLDEVHRLMENRQWRFALCGSSARKLRRAGTNLLGGRALTRELDAFSFAELDQSFDLEHSLQWGNIPWVQLDRNNAADILNSYVNTYIKEEIKEEGVVRKLQPFLRFLGIAGQLNSQVVNAQSISRDAAVPRSTVDTYFSILVDTLLGSFLHAYRPSAKIREQTHPKFYWFDPGVARAAAGLLFDPVDRIWQGTALETLIYHELKTYNHTRNRNRGIYFYRTITGSEVDFVIETQKKRPASPPHVICLEVKLAQKWDRRWEQPIRSLKGSKKLIVDRMVGIYTGERSYNFDGFDVLPVEEFLRQLHQGKIF
ncbi:MAG: AAA family ATPase [bacterium]|nr:AAA family ATPase [bacterium]